MVLNAFKSRIFSLQPTECSGKPGMLVRVAEVSNRKFSDYTRLKILTRNCQILQILLIRFCFKDCQ